MRFLGFTIGGGPQETEEARQRREESLRSLKAGGLPLNAIDRLREQASRRGSSDHLFTSDLSVNEVTLVREGGYEPLGQVMGSSMYHVGGQYMTQNWRIYRNPIVGVSYELDVLTKAFYNARHLALGRMQQEAELLGATGVVGVRLERRIHGWAANLLEFVAIGTAIREADVSSTSASGVKPFLSDLSGDEFWTLRQAGYRPVGFALGNCTYYCIPTWKTQRVIAGAAFSGSWVNQEFPECTQAIYAARSLAMERMEDETRTCSAEGVVGADLKVDIERRGQNNMANPFALVFHFTAIGTAITQFRYRKRDLRILVLLPLARKEPDNSNLKEEE